MHMMERTRQSWSIIVFSYNEAGTLRSVIDSVEQFFETTGCVRNEVVVVDDGSTDDSREIVRTAAEEFSNIRAVYHPRNLGIGHALRSGYAAVRYENVSAVPGDGQFNVAELVPFASLSPKTFVSFYRVENTIYSRGRNILSFVNKKLNAMFLGLVIQDVNWVKIYKRADLAELDLKMKSSLVESEVCAKLLLGKCRLIESESVYHPRKAGQSKGASFPVVLQAALETLKLICTVNLYRITHRRELRCADAQTHVRRVSR